MSELLDRTYEEQTVEQREVAGGPGPPLEMPEIERMIRPRWPRSAKIVVAVLGVVAAAGVFGTVVQYVDDDTDAQVSELTEERDALLEQNAELEDDLATATVVMGDLTGQIDDLLMTNETLSAERDALVAMFPMVVDTSLVGVDVTGTYAATWVPAYNSGLADIALPNVVQVTIGQTAEGWLQVSIPGVVTADLLRTDGALFTMVDTTTAVPPVDGVARMARVAIAIYAGETVTAIDGTTTITDLGMSIAISTPATGSAPAGVALYGAELTPQT